MISPISALRFIPLSLRRTEVRLTPGSRALNLGFYKAIGRLTFYGSIIFYQPIKIAPHASMSSISIIKPYFVENRGRILVGLVCLILVDMLQLIVPRVIKRAVDDLTLLRVETGHLLDYAYTIAGIAVLIGVFRYVWRLCLLGHLPPRRGGPAQPSV